MTQPYILPWALYVSNGGLTYAYPFRVLDGEHIEVYVDGVQRLDITVTNVGTITGGTIVFGGSVAVGSLIFIRRVTSRTQDLDYIEGGVITAESLESGFDKGTMLSQDIVEELSRRPALEIPINDDLRNLYYPEPRPLALWGWDATGTRIAYYDAPIVQIIPPGSTHLVFAESVVTVPAVAGAQTLISANVFPAGCIRVGAIVRVATTFGASQGLTTFAAGSPDTMDRWGTGLERTATAAPVGANNPGMWTSYIHRPIPDGQTVLLTAESGLFDSVGSAVITATFMVFTAA